jgi:type VI secretion system secreted protein Hcp
MPGNAFICFTTQGDKTTPGESLQTGHLGADGWIEISDWSWEVESEASHLKGTGAAVGKPTAGALSFTHYYDKSSPVLQQYIVKGSHFKSVTLDMLKQTGDDQPELFFQLMASNVFITKVTNSGEEDGSLKQEVEMVFKEVGIGYKRQDNKGDLKEAKYFHWNIAEMTSSTNQVSLKIK